MRLFEIEGNPYEQFDQLVTTKCSEYVGDYPEWFLHNRLYRGFQQNFGTYKEMVTPIDRTPLDSSKAFQDFLKEIYKKLGIKARRDNSIFCSFDDSFASRYGNLYVIVPCNGFNVSQITNHIDLYKETASLFKNGLIGIKYKNVPIYRYNELFHLANEIKTINTDDEHQKMVEFLQSKDITDLDDYGSFNELKSLFSEFTGISKDEAEKRMYSMANSPSFWHKVVWKAGIEDTGLSEYFKKHITTDLSKMSHRGEILLGDSKYILANNDFVNQYMRWKRNET